jgi:hypothetical protein
MNIPGLAWLMGCQIGNIMILVIAHQDRHSVNTQLPKADRSSSGELLFKGYRPIMELCECGSG